MIEASCHCGAVRMEIDAAPAEVNECACSHCQKRGALWAYYSPKAVKITQARDATTIYMCNDEVIESHFCRMCGCTAYWLPVDKHLDRMGVNARLMDTKVLAAAPIRKRDEPKSR